MKFRMMLKTVGGQIIESPPIVPNNPLHSMDHKSIESEIIKTGESMLKRVPHIAAYHVVRDMREEVARLWACS